MLRCSPLRDLKGKALLSSCVPGHHAAVFGKLRWLHVTAFMVEDWHDAGRPRAVNVVFNYSLLVAGHDL